MSGSLGKATLDLDANMDPLEQSLRRSKAEVQQWINNIEKNRPKVDPLVQNERALAGLRQVTDAANRLSGLNPVVTVKANADGAITSMRVAQKSATDLGATTARSGKQMASAFDGALDSLSPIPMTMAGVGAGAALAGAAVGKFMLDSLATFGTFEAGMQQVWTLLPNASQAAMDRMSQQVLDFATDMNVLPTQVIPALYEALGSGVPEDNVFEFLRVAQQAAIGGNTELAISTDALTSVINAYGAENLSAAEAADIYFQTIALGKVSFKDLGGSMYDVAPVAAKLGVGLEQVGAAYATMTAQGTPARVVGTQLRQVLLELSDSGTDVAKTFEQITGQSFAEFIASGGTLQEALVLLDTHAREAGVGVNELFGSVEAGQAVIALTGDNASKAADDLLSIGDASGSTAAAYGKMANGLKQDSKELAVAWERLKIATGEALAPAAGAALGVAADNVGYLVTVLEKASDAAGLLGDALGLIPKPLADIVTWGARLAFLPTSLGAIGDAYNKVGGALGLVDDTANTFSMAPVITELQRVQTEADKTKVALDFRNIIGPLLPEMLEGPIFSTELIGSVEEFTNWLAVGIPAAGEAALGSIDTVVAGIDSGFVDASDAVDAFVANGQIGFGEFVELASSKLAELEQAKAQAFADDDAAALSAANQGIAIYSGLIAEATARQNEFNAAQQNWNTVQGVVDQGVSDASNNMNQWQSDISEAEKALGILDQQLADGTITQDEYNTKQGELSGYLTRLQGGLEDQNDAYLASVQAKADFMAKQDELNAALANGEITQEEYNSAIGAAEEAMIGAQTPIESLIKAITDLVTALTGVPPETDATVTVDTVVAEEAIGTVQEGFTEFDGGESQGTLTVDNSDAVADTEKASEDAVAFAEAEYMAQVEADPAVALRETAAAQQEADDFVNGGPYVSLLEANDQASLPIGDVRGSLNSLISQNYTVHVTADISAVYAAVAEANALLPSSPAEKGPLARTPKWDWAFASAVPAAERYVTQAADVAAGFMPFDGVARTGALSEAVDWGWLFEDIPADAEDYAAQSADAFISFFSGNLEDIANGQAMYDAQQALEESLMIRQIAVDAGLGADVIAEIDARIQAQRDAIEAIGAVVGSGIVDGLIEEVEQFDIGDALQLPNGGSPWSLDDIVSGDALADAEAAIAEMQSLLAIAMESGDQELIDLYTAQLAELERQLAVLHEVLGTQTVQDLQAAADAAAAAEQNTADLVERFMQMGADPAGAITSAYDAVEELRKALELAILTPGTPMDVINELLAAYQAAQVTAAQMATDAAKMFQAGLIDAEELAAMAEAGGQAFIDGFNDAMGDPNAYDDIVQAQEDALAAVRQVQLDQLKLMIEDAEDGGISLVDELIDGVLSGATDFEDALEVINQIAEQNGEGLQTTLADLYLSLQDDLQAALAAGTDTTIIEQNMQIIRDILASLGLEIDDVLGKATQAAIAAQSWNKSGGPGGSLGNSNYAGRRSTMDVMGAATDIYSANNAALLAGTSAYPNTSSAMTQAMSQGASTSVAVAAPEVTVNTQNYMDSRPLVTTTIQQIVSAVPPGRRM